MCRWYKFAFVLSDLPPKRKKADVCLDHVEGIDIPRVQWTTCTTVCVLGCKLGEGFRRRTHGKVQLQVSRHVVAAGKGAAIDALRDLEGLSPLGCWCAESP